MRKLRSTIKKKHSERIRKELCCSIKRRFGSEGCASDDEAKYPGVYIMDVLIGGKFHLGRYILASKPLQMSQQCLIVYTDIILSYIFFKKMFLTNNKPVLFYGSFTRTVRDSLFWKMVTQQILRVNLFYRFLHY